MSRRWWQYRVRTLLIAVAAVGLMMGAWIGLARFRALRRQRLERASWHAERATNEANHAAQFTLLARVAERDAAAHPSRDDYEELARVHTRRMLYHRAMERRLESAADLPWNREPRENSPPP
jgi:hypothetical protein